MAFDLSLSPPADAGPAPDRMLRAGLGGVNQAARATALLRELLLPGNAAGGQTSLLDIADMLRGKAASIGVKLEIDAMVGGATTTLPLAVASLLAGIAALDEAPSAATVRFVLANGDGGSVLRAEHKAT
jgi:hypothetical protein